MDLLEELMASMMDCDIDEIQPPRWLVLDSSNSKKVSFHVMARGWVFEDNAHAGAWTRHAEMRWRVHMHGEAAERLRLRTKTGTSFIADFAVYDNRRLFRLPFSCKRTPRRPARGSRRGSGAAAKPAAQGPPRVLRLLSAEDAARLRIEPWSPPHDPALEAPLANGRARLLYDARVGRGDTVELDVMDIRDVHGGLPSHGQESALETLRRVAKLKRVKGFEAMDALTLQKAVNAVTKQTEHPLGRRSVSTGEGTTDHPVMVALLRALPDMGLPVQSMQNYDPLRESALLRLSTKTCRIKKDAHRSNHPFLIVDFSRVMPDPRYPLHGDKTLPYLVMRCRNRVCKTKDPVPIVCPATVVAALAAYRSELVKFGPPGPTAGASPTLKPSAPV